MRRKQRRLASVSPCLHKPPSGANPKWESSAWRGRCRLSHRPGLFQKVGYERCRINECNVTHSQLLDPIVFEPSLIGRRANYRVVILHTVVANIPICLFDTVSTAANNKVHCHEIAYASGTRPTAEGFWFYTAWGVTATEG